MEKKQKSEVMKFSLTYLFLLGFSVAALMFEAPTVLYLWCNDRTMQSIITSTWVTYHVGEANNAISILYIFVLLFVALPRLFALFLPRLRVLTLYAALLQFIGCCYQVSLFSHVWLTSSYDIAYVATLSGTCLMLVVRYLSMTTEADARARVDLEKRRANLQHIRAMRAAYQESKRTAVVERPKKEAESPASPVQSS